MGSKLDCPLAVTATPPGGGSRYASGKLVWPWRIHGASWSIFRSGREGADCVWFSPRCLACCFASLLAAWPQRRTELLLPPSDLRTCLCVSVFIHRNSDMGGALTVNVGMQSYIPIYIVKLYIHVVSSNIAGIIQNMKRDPQYAMVSRPLQLRASEQTSVLPVSCRG